MAVADELAWLPRWFDLPRTLNRVVGWFAKSALASPQGPIEIGGTRFGTTADSASHTVQMPSWRRSGQLAIMYLVFDGSPETGLSAGPVGDVLFEGWNALLAFDGASAQCRVVIQWKVLDGSEPPTYTFISSPAEEMVGMVRIYERHGCSATAPMAASASGTSTTPDPPSLTPSAGPDHYLWVIGCGIDEGNTTDATAPAGYPAPKRLGSSSDGNGCLLHYTSRRLEGAAEHPGALSGLTSEQWGSFTIAIPSGDEGRGFPPELASAANSRNAAGGTSHTVVLPSPRELGDLVFLKVVSRDATATQSWPAGWTQLFSVTSGNSSGVRVEVRYRVMDGTELNTITVTTSASVQTQHEGWLVTGHDPDRPPEASTATDTATTIEAPSRNMATVDEYLVITGFGATDDDEIPVYWPVSVTPNQQVESSQAGNSVMSASAWTTRRGRNDFAMDVGWSNGLLIPNQTNQENFIIGGVENYVAYTIFVYPLIGCQPLDDYAQSYVLELRPESMKQQLEYATRILQAYDGTEQRLTVRCRPRQTFQVKWVLPSIAHARRLHQRFLRYQDTPFDLPLWGEEVCVPAALTAGATTINATFTWSQIGAGSGVLIVNPDESTYEFKLVTGRTASSITVSALANSYPARSYVVPLIQVWAQGEPKLSRYRTAGAELEFTAVGVYQPPLYDGGASAITLASYDGFAVLDKRHLSGHTLDQMFEGGLTVIDFGNKVDQYTGWVQDVGAIAETRQFLVDDAEDRTWWNKFLTTIAGARETFLAPTWRDDLVLSAQPSVGATTILVTDDPNYNNEYEVSGAHDYLQLETAAGIIYRKVTNAVDNGNGTVTLTLDAALPATTAGSTINRISFLERVRLASDIATLEYGAETRPVLTIATRTVGQ